MVHCHDKNQKRREEGNDRPVQDHDKNARKIEDAFEKGFKTQGFGFDLQAWY